MLVLDASSAYDLLTEARSLSKISGTRDLIAPDLIVAELLNVRWKVVHAGREAPALDMLMGLLERLRILPAFEYAADAAALAERLDHPVHDCLYVAVAQREHAKLLTLDQRLIKKLRSARMSKILRS